MNDQESSKLQALYQASSYFVIMDNNGLFFAESPEEQGLPEDEKQESVLRLFLDRDDADIYCEYVNITTGVGNLVSYKVTSVSLADLWHLLDDIDKISYYTYGCNVRFAFCMLDEEGWPIDLDTIHSVYAEVN